jgi:hypothetical protein
MALEVFNAAKAKSLANKAKKQEEESKAIVQLTHLYSAIKKHAEDGEFSLDMEVLHEGVAAALRKEGYKVNWVIGSGYYRDDSHWKISWG